MPKISSPKVSARQDRREHVERPVGMRGVRQVALGQHEGDDAERRIDGEQDRPRGDREQRRADRRAGGQRGRDHGGVEAQPAAQLVARIDRAHQRRLDRHDGRTAQPLEGASQQEPGQRGREGAADRGQREQHQPEAIDVAVADDVGQRRHRQQRDDERDLGRVDDPDRAFGRDVEVLGDVGQRQVGHRVAEHRHHQPDGDGRHREPARPAGGHSVGRCEGAA